MESQETTQLPEIKKSGFSFLIIINVVLFLAFSASTFYLWRTITFDKNSSTSTEEGSVQGVSSKDPEHLEKLADSLKTAGFVIYGDTRDEKTKKQLELFGQASAKLDFVECDPQSTHSNTDECVAKGVDEYPTWVSGENKFAGVRSISELEKMLAVTVL